MRSTWSFILPSCGRRLASHCSWPAGVVRSLHLKKTPVALLVEGGKKHFIHRLSLILLRLCISPSAGILTRLSAAHILSIILPSEKVQYCCHPQLSLKYQVEICVFSMALRLRRCSQPWNHLSCCAKRLGAHAFAEAFIWMHTSGVRCI